MNDLIKQNIVSLISLAATIIGGWLFIDERYAHAEELTQIKQVYEKKLDDLQKGQMKARALTIEDKLFEFETKQSLTQVEKAVKQRYERELETINNQSKQK